MSVHLKTLGLHVYLAATKKSYLGNSKHIEANAQALVALRNTLTKDYLYIASHCDSIFAVWNTLTSQATNDNQCGERIKWRRVRPTLLHDPRE